MGKPSVAGYVGEHVAFYLARKGSAYLLLIRNSPAAVRGHLPPLRASKIVRVKGQTVQALWRRTIHIPMKRDAEAVVPLN